MAGSLNKVLLIGRLGADPEIKQMVNGKSVARLSLATSQSWKDKNTGEKKEKTEWHRVVIFNEGLVGVVQQYVKKGAQVYIEGQLTTRKWTGNNPIRLVIDPNNSIDANAAVLNGAAKTVVFNNSVNKREANVNWVAITKTEMIKGILCWCFANEIQSIMVEGGAATIQGFLTTNFWDECRMLEAGKPVVNGIKAPLLPEGKKTSKKLVGDILHLMKNERP